MSIKFERQALVRDAEGELRKRWVVRLRRAEAQAIIIDYPTDEVNPTLAIVEAVRKHVEYADNFIAAVPCRIVLSHVAQYHPSVTEDGWLRIVAINERRDELPGEWHVRLQAHEGIRDTGIEVQN